MTRHTDEVDNRIVLAGVTPRGREILVPATEAVNGVFESIELDESGVDALIDLLNPIRDAAGDHVETPAETDVRD
jgi:hypothetical protein